MRRPPIPSVLGTFQITRELGQRSATLYVGQRDSDRAQVVIKLGDDETSFARIRHEAEVLGSLSHPHIVTFIDAGVFEGLPWYAMELVCGPSLAEVIARRWAERGEVMPPVALGALDEVLEQLCSLCSALSYLHGEGFVHADIKPANLIVGPDDTLTLIDFGLASRFGASGREILHLESDGITGTPAYMSPEQIRGEYVDARSDLYSLGCTVFEMLTGRPPFLGRLQAVLRAHLASEPPSIDSLVSGCPPPLVELVARLLSKQPQRRPSAAEALRRTASSLLPSERRARLRERGAAPAHSTTSPHLHRVDFVGREEEFDVLCREIERTTAGEGGVVLIEGESGVGKTRLVMETAIAAAEHGLRVIAGECRALAPGEDEQRIDAGSLEPLLPAFEALADLCIARPELRPSLVGARLSLLTPFVPRLAMLTQRGSAGGLPDDGPNRLRDAALEALAALASHRALMLVIDDLQWADALTLDVVGELADNGRIPGLLLVAAMRMSSRTRIVELAGRASVHIELGRLARPWVGELVKGMLSLSSVSERVVGALSEVSEGNPLFVAELLRAAIANEAITLDRGGHWCIDSMRFDDMLATRVPSSLHELVTQRLAQLGPQERELLEFATVLGRSFSITELEHAHAHAHKEHHEDQLGTELSHVVEVLVDRHILERGEGSELRFTHDKLREVPYAKLDEARRGTLHLRVAEALDHSDNEGGLARAGVHWSRAGYHERAFERFERAADQAARSYANDQAISLCEAAIDETRRFADETRGWPVWERLADVLTRIGEHRRAHEALTRALELLPAEVPLTTRARIHEKLATTWESRMNHGAAVEALHAGLAAIGEASLESEAGARAWATLLLKEAWLWYWRNDLSRLEAVIERLEPVIESIDAPDMSARLEQLLVNAGNRRDRFRPSAQTVAHGYAGLVAARRSEQPDLITVATYMLGFTLFFAGEFVEAERHLRAAMDSARERGNAWHTRLAGGYLTFALRRQRRAEAVRACADELLGTTEGGLLEMWSALVHANMAWVALEERRFDAARDHITRATDFWARSPINYVFQWAALLPRLELELRAGESGWSETLAILLRDDQHPLDEALHQAIEAALAAVEAEDEERGEDLAWEVLDQARALAYL